MMKIDKIIRKYVPTEIKIKEITLLSDEEYKKTKKNIKPIEHRWWLRRTTNSRIHASIVSKNGSVSTGIDASVKNGFNAVRPALHIESDLKVGDEFRFGNKDWTVISNNTALCDREIDYDYFNYKYDIKSKDENANNYEKSKIKPKLDQWLIDELSKETSKNKGEIVEKIEKEYIPTETEIKEITLLTSEEYFLSRENIKSIEETWWLRTPSMKSDCVTAVWEVEVDELDIKRIVEYERITTSGIAVRPALHIESDLKVGDEFRFGNKDWTVINNNLALCDSKLYNGNFNDYEFQSEDENANKYENSLIKPKLDQWLEKALIQEMNRGKKHIKRKKR